MNSENITSKADYIAAISAANLATTAAKAEGVTDEATLRLISMSAGWATLTKLGYTVPAEIAEQLAQHEGF